MTESTPHLSSTDAPDRPVGDLFREVDKQVATLRARLPPSLDGRAISELAKVPYKAALLDAGLSYRAAEIAEAVLDQISARRMVAAILLARAALETAAVHFYATKKILEAIETRDVGIADDILFRALVGSRVYGEGTVNPINVLTAIDHANRAL